MVEIISRPATKADVQLSNVDNTSDADKPVSSAQAAAITSAMSSITKTSIGLGNVDNTSDASKPVSTAQQVALNAKQDIISLTTSGTSGAATLIGNTINIPQYSSGTGDVSSNTSVSVDGEVSLFSGVSGKTIKRATQTGIANLTSGVLSTVTAPSGVIVGTSDVQTLTNKSIVATQLTGTIQAAQMPALTGDATTSAGSVAVTVGRLNGVSLGGLATGILKNTTSTGVPSIAVAGTDYQIPITLTTVGTSGAASFTAGTLNIPQYSAGGGGDVSSNTAVSVVNEIALFYDTGGKIIKRSTGSGIATLTSGVLSTVTAPAGAVVGTTDTQTLTNKSIDAGQLTGTVVAARMPALTGDVTSTVGTVATVVGKINGVSLAGLATGLLKNTISTGVPSIATAGTDYQAPVTLTTSGTSGVATFTSNTLNIPNYSGARARTTITATTYTFVLGDAGNVVSFNNAAAQTITIPPNSSVAYPVNTQIDLLALGAGKVSFAPGSGVTLNPASTRSLNQYTGGMLFQVATDSWILSGAVVA